MEATKLKGWLAASAVLLLAAGGSLGFLAATFLRGEPELPAESPYASPLPSSTPILTVDNGRVFEILNLGEDQRAAADRILRAHFDELKRIREKREALGQKLQDDFQKLLDPAQQEHMTEIMRRLKIHEVTEAVSFSVAMYKRELGLNSSQEDKFYSALLEDRLQRDEHMRDCWRKKSTEQKVSREETRKFFARLDEERSQKLRPILSEAQWEKFKKIDERSRDPFRRGGRGGERKDLPRPPPEGLSGPPPGAQPAAPAPAPAPATAPGK